MSPPRPAPAAVALDLDGTLVDTMGEIADAVNEVLEHACGRGGLSRAQVQALTGRGTPHLLAGGLALLQAPPAGEQALRQLAERFRAAYAQRLGTTARLYPGVEQGLALLASRGLPLACTTNKLWPHARRLLERLGLLHWFSALVCPDTAGARKPDAAILREAARQLGQPVARLVLIGDSRNDILAAQAAGCAVVCVAGGYDDPQALHALAPAPLAENFLDAARRVAADVLVPPSPNLPLPRTVS